MTILPFPKPEPGRHFLPVTAFIDMAAPLEDGDIVVWAFGNDPHPGRVAISIWGEPCGRDGNGRFVAKGSPYEMADLDGFKYCPKNLESGFLKIFGRLEIGGLLLG